MLIYKKVLLFFFSIMLIGEVFPSGKIVNTSMPCKLLEGISSREYSIYLPESYGKDKNKKYPVCYLLHGGNCSCTDWDTYGNLRVVADSLIKCGEMEEMIIVCPEGNKNNMIWFLIGNMKISFFLNLYHILKRTIMLMHVKRADSLPVIQWVEEHQ